MHSEVIALNADLTVEKFQNLVNEYVSERGWKRYHKPKDIAISVAIESSELLELFQWKPDPMESGKLDRELKARIGEEIADIVIYAACMANALDIDLSEALIDKMHKNKSRYPVEKVAEAKDWDEVRSVCAKRSGKKGDD